MSKLLIQYPTFSLYKTSQDLYSEHQKLVERLNKVLKDNLPFSLKEVGFIADGYHHPLDHLRELRNNSRQIMTQLQTQYIERTEIPPLKIRCNNIIGYHIKIPPSQVNKIPFDFIHKQTLASSVRYSTLELLDLEKQIQSAEQDSLSLELHLFQELVKEALKTTHDIFLYILMVSRS